MSVTNVHENHVIHCPQDILTHAAMKFNNQWDNIDVHFLQEVWTGEVNRRHILMVFMYEMPGRCFTGH